MTTLAYVPLNLLPQTLPVVRHMLTAMLERRPGWATEEQIGALLAQDYMQLHLAIDDANRALAAMVTEIKVTPAGKRICAVVGIAGENRHLWTHHLDELEEWARGVGCSAVHIVDGRKGWLREERLKPYRCTYSFYRDITQ